MNVTVFRYERMIAAAAAAAAEIDNHINRERNMDTRPTASDCGFVV